MVATLTAKQKEANRLLGGPARNVMLRGGSRSGKTFILVRAIVQRALNARESRHAIFRFRFNHAKTSIWSDTLPKVLKLCFPSLRVRFDKTDFYVELPNGSQIWIAGLDDKERVEKILGQEYVTLYFNESSQIPWASVETAMSRLAQKCELSPEIAKATGRQYLSLKAYFDCNPPSKLQWSYSLFRAKGGSKTPLRCNGSLFRLTHPGRAATAVGTISASSLLASASMGAGMSSKTEPAKCHQRAGAGGPLISTTAGVLIALLLNATLAATWCGSP